MSFQKDLTRIKMMWHAVLIVWAVQMAVRAFFVGMTLRRAYFFGNFILCKP